MEGGRERQRETERERDEIDRSKDRQRETQQDTKMWWKERVRNGEVDKATKNERKIKSMIKNMIMLNDKRGMRQAVLNAEYVIALTEGSL